MAFQWREDGRVSAIDFIYDHLRYNEKDIDLVDYVFLNYSNLEWDGYEQEWDGVRAEINERYEKEIEYCRLNLKKAIEDIHLRSGEDLKAMESGNLVEKRTYSPLINEFNEAHSELNYLLYQKERFKEALEPDWLRRTVRK